MPRYIRSRLCVYGAMVLLIIGVAACTQTVPEQAVATTNPTAAQTADDSLPDATQPAVTDATEAEPAIATVEPADNTDCMDDTTPPSSWPDTVLVYFFCGDTNVLPTEAPLRAVTRPVTDTADISVRVQTALNALRAGPTAAEQTDGFSPTILFDVPVELVETVTISDGHHLIVSLTDELANVNNINTSHNIGAVLRLLNANTLQFPEIQTVEYQLAGNCEAFRNMLGITDCQSRSGSDE